MARSNARDEHNGADEDNEETRSLLSDSSSDLVVHSRDDILPKAATPTPSHTPSLTPSPTPGAPRIPPPRRQSSLAQPRPDGAPRTPNRVRFEVDDRLAQGIADENNYIPSPDSPGSDWMDDEDYMTSRGGRRGSGGEQRLPLLTGIEAPSVTVASSDVGFTPEDLLESARPKSGMNSAFMNMANSIIGAGIIGQPYALRQAGLITGTVLLVALTVTVDWTIRLIVVNSKLSGTDSFQSTVQHCFGKSGLIAISVAQWAFAFGGMVAFCIIVGDSIPHVLSALFPSLSDMPFLWLLTDRRAIIVIFILGISYPLSLYRDIAKLAKASTLALISMLVIIVTVITQGFRVPAEMKGQLSGGILIHGGIFQAIGVISFAFVCHHNSLLIYGSLRKPTLDRFAKVTHYSTGISMVACLAMALAGYLTFGNKTQGNVLNNFPSDNIMVNIARLYASLFPAGFSPLCFGLNMLTTLPLECFVCREVMENYYFPGEAWHPNRHLIFTTSLVVSSMTLSLLTCDLGAVFELIGATSACALAYILPPLCFIKLSSRTWKTYVAGAVMGFGCIVMGISLMQAIAKIWSNEGGVQQCS